LKIGPGLNNKNNQILKMQDLKPKEPSQNDDEPVGRDGPRQSAKKAICEPHESGHVESNSKEPREHDSDGSLLDLLGCEEKEVNLESSMSDAEINGHWQDEPASDDGHSGQSEFTRDLPVDAETSGESKKQQERRGDLGRGMIQDDPGQQMDQMNGNPTFDLTTNTLKKNDFTPRHIV
jgi:hypothetical protein